MPDAPRRGGRAPSGRRVSALGAVAAVAAVTGLVTVGPLAPGAPHDSEEAAEPGDQAPDAAGDAAEAAPACRVPAGPGRCVAWFDGVGGGGDTTAVGGRVYRLSGDGRLRALEVVDGTERFSRRLSTGSAPPRLLDPSVGALPVRTDDGVLLVGAGSGRPLGDIPLRPGAQVGAWWLWFVVADDREVAAWTVAGERGWSRPLGEDETVVLTTSGPVVHDGRRATLTRLDRDTGDDRWRVELPPGGVDVVGDGAGGLLIALAPDRGAAELRRVGPDGGARWTTPLPGPVRWLAVDDHDAPLALVLERGERAQLQLLDPDDGGTRAVVDIDEAADRLLPPRLDAEHAAVASTRSRARLLVVGREDGLTRLHRDLPRAARDVALTPSGSIVVTDAAEVHAWELASGTSRWVLDLANARVLDTAPLVVAGPRGVAGLEER